MTALYVASALVLGATLGFCWRKTVRLGVVVALLGACWPQVAWT
jgi:hypothetical protein